MRRAFGRLLFAAFAVGQLQLIPAALACVREHRRTEPAPHCQQAAHDDMARQQAGQAAARALPDAQTLCALLGPCATPSPALMPAVVAAAPAAVAETAGWPTPSAPPSVDLTPQPPPPQA